MQISFNYISWIDDKTYNWFCGIIYLIISCFFPPLTTAEGVCMDLPVFAYVQKFNSAVWGLTPG